MIDIKELYWVAGILEGEGSFYLQTHHRLTQVLGMHRQHAIIKVGMTDSDVIYKVSEIMTGGLKVSIEERKLKSYKTIYTYKVVGESAIQWMMTLYSLMGNRRRERIREILEVWKNQPTSREYFDNRIHCKHGHEWIEENIYIDKNGTKVCKICRDISLKRFKEEGYCKKISKEDAFEDIRRMLNKSGHDPLKLFNEDKIH